MHTSNKVHWISVVPLFELPCDEEGVRSLQLAGLADSSTALSSWLFILL